MLAPIAAFLATLLTQATTLVVPVVGIALLIAGGVMALGNHQRGKEAIVCALLGGAVMLSSGTIAAAVHP